MKAITRQITCIFLCAMFTLLVTPKLDAQDAPSEAVQVAEEELPFFLSNLSESTASHLEDYGFSEDDNLDEAFLGRPFLNYGILATKVANYKEGDSIYDVLTKSSGWYFPVMIGDETKCLLRVEKVDDDWKAVAFGYAGFSKRMALVREVWPVSEGYDPLFSMNAPVYRAYFSVPQVDLYNLTRISYESQNESENELIRHYSDLQPLSEAMKDLASYIDVDDNEHSGIEFGSEGGDGGCFISTAKGSI